MKKLIFVLLLSLVVTGFNACSTEKTTNTANNSAANANSENKSLDFVAAQKQLAEMDKPISSLSCPGKGYDPAKYELHKFACEFELAIVNFANDESVKRTDQYGNWFGRLAAFGYEVDAKGQKYKEEKDPTTKVITDIFRNKLRDGGASGIIVKVYETDFSSMTETDDGDKNPLTRTVSFNVQITSEGLNLPEGTYKITYNLKNADWETTNIKIE